MNAQGQLLRGSASVEARGAEFLVRLSRDQALNGAEIGVFAGAFSRHLLTIFPQLRLTMIDSWLGTASQPKEYVECGDWHATLSAEEQERFRRAAVAAVWFAGDRATIWRSGSAEAAGRVEARSLDFVFIDADHSHGGCAADIAMWWPKIRVGGWLCGHDYDHPTRRQFGVKRAVDEAVAVHNGWSLELGNDLTWFVRIP